MTRIDFREKGEFNATNSKAIIQETKDVYSICTAFLRSTFKFEHF